MSTIQSLALVTVKCVFLPGKEGALTGVHLFMGLLLISPEIAVESTSPAPLCCGWWFLGTRRICVPPGPLDAYAQPASLLLYPHPLHLTAFTCVPAAPAPPPAAGTKPPHLPPEPLVRRSGRFSRCPREGYLLVAQILNMLRGLWVVTVSFSASLEKSTVSGVKEITPFPREGRGETGGLESPGCPRPPDGWAPGVPLLCPAGRQTPGPFRCPQASPCAATAEAWVTEGLRDERSEQAAECGLQSMARKRPSRSGRAWTRRPVGRAKRPECASELSVLGWKGDGAGRPGRAVRI